MTELGKLVQSIKEESKRKQYDPYKPAAYWSEDDRFLGKPGKAFVAILRTSGCTWNKRSGCTMCGYFNDSVDGGVDEESLNSQLDFLLSKYNNEAIIKIFTSGSFLDDKEITPRIQFNLLKAFANKKSVRKISIESRPEFIKRDRIKDLVEIVGDKKLEVSIGLESANDDILRYSINKGISFKNYLKAAFMLREEDTLIKTYILIKPPFLGEYDSIEDSIKTVRKVKDVTDTISINPVSIHKNTLVEYLWNRGEYRAPWLWSVVYILKKSKEIAPNLDIKCDVTGGGRRRGAHNCGKCDRAVLDAIHRFSIEQDVSILDNLNCKCREIWRRYVDIERFSYGLLPCEAYDNGC